MYLLQEVTSRAATVVEATAEATVARVATKVRFTIPHCILVCLV